MNIDFAKPLVLLLLPLALLPLLRRRSEVLVFPTLLWLPPDRLGELLGLVWRALAVGAIACTVLALAGPGERGGQQLRSGRGAELLILFDRSSSMDAVVHLNGVADASFSVTESKGEIARRLLGEFIAKRPEDRLAFMAFGTSPLPAVPFTRRADMVQAALAATGIGRGLPDTRLGVALLAAIDQFRGQPYGGSRIVLIVSDGGAKLDAPTRQRIEAGLAREKVGLYWVYIRSGPNSPDLRAEARGGYDSTDELALHDFFRSLPTPYRLYQTDDAAALGRAMAEIDRQQKSPLSYVERLPRRDRSRPFLLAAASCCAALLALGAWQVRGWASSVSPA